MGEIEPRQAGALAAAIPELPVTWADDDAISADAARLAIALDRPAYACTYLALANRIGAKLVTADANLVSVLSTTEHGATVIVLESLAAE